MVQDEKPARQINGIIAMTGITMRKDSILLQRNDTMQLFLAINSVSLLLAINSVSQLQLIQK